MEYSKPFFGVAYYDNYLPKSRAEEDMKLLKEAGFNLIRFGMNCWKDWEPRENEFDFTSFHSVLSAAQGAGIQVLLVDPTDSVPDWFASSSADGDKLRERMLRRMAEQSEPYSCVTGFQLGRDTDSIWEMEKREKILRKYGKAGQIITGSPYFNIKNGEHIQADPFDIAPFLDKAGCSIFHSSGSENTGAEISMSGDIARGIKKDNYLVLETQCQTTASCVPYPGQLRLSAYHHLASGADCVAYDRWNSEYTGSCRKGILNHDLVPGRVYRECAAIGAELNRIGQRLVGLKKQNRVAIMVSASSLEQAVWPENAELGYSDYLRWVYDSFYRLNVEVDIIPDTQRDFTGYELLVTPCLYSAEENLIWAIRDFVSGGGYLISTFRSFFADEQGVVRADVQPYGMTDVFGMSYEEYAVPQFTCLPEYDAEVKEWMELLHQSGSRAIAEYDCPGWRGTPAATVSRYGKGGAAYIGCYSPDGLEPILLRLLATWHIPVPEISWPVVIKRGINQQGKPVVYLLHYSDSARVIPSPSAGQELLSGQNLEEGAPVELKPWDVKILEGNV